MNGLCLEIENKMIAFWMCVISLHIQGRKMDGKWAVWFKEVVVKSSSKVCIIKRFSYCELERIIMIMMSSIRYHPSTCRYDKLWKPSGKFATKRLQPTQEYDLVK